MDTIVVLCLLNAAMAVALYIQHREVAKLRETSGHLEHRIIYLSAIACKLAGGRVILYRDCYRLDLPDEYQKVRPINMSHMTRLEAEGEAA